MSKTVIDRDTRKAIIQGTYKCFRSKERENKSKSQTIMDIVRLIKKELRDNAD